MDAIDNKLFGKGVEGFTVTGNWHNQASQLKSIFDQLTKSDLKFEDGSEGQLLDRIALHLDRKIEEVIALIRSLAFPTLELAK
jgi:hypothetical protein